MTNTMRTMIAALNNAIDAAQLTDAQRIAFAVEMGANVVPNTAEPNTKAWSKLFAARREFVNAIVGEAKHEVRNAMNGEMVMETYATPYCCSVRSESYWCN